MCPLCVFSVFYRPEEKGLRTSERVHGGRGALGSATAAQALSSHVSAIFRMGLRLISSHRSSPFAATLWWIPSLKCNSSLSIYLCNEIIFLYLLFHVFSFHSPRKFSLNIAALQSIFVFLMAVPPAAPLLCCL